MAGSNTLRVAAVNLEAASKGRLSKVAKDVYSLVWEDLDSAYPWLSASQAFVVLEDNVLVFDTGFSADQAKTLDQSISGITDKKPRYVVNSHDHPEQVFGNSFFYRKYSGQGLDIVSNVNCARRVQELGPQRLRQLRKSDKMISSLLTSVRIIPPNIIYDESGLKLEIEGTKFVIIHPENGAHTLGDTVVAIPDKGVMILGDVLWNSFLPDLKDANIEAWIEFLENIDFGTYSKFVPGHGIPCGKEEILSFSKYLSAVLEHLLSADSKMEKDKLRSCFEIEGSEKWKFHDVVDQNISALFSTPLAKNLK